LEHSLHQLVRELHFKNSYHPMPHPVTALLGVSKKRRNAGPQAFSRTELLDLTHRLFYILPPIPNLISMFLAVRTCLSKSSSKLATLWFGKGP
jgi:hypothetical protein